MATRTLAPRSSLLLPPSLRPPSRSIHPQSPSSLPRSQQQPLGATQPSRSLSTTLAVRNAFQPTGPEIASANTLNGKSPSGKLRKTLADLIADSIKATGPISVASFMRTALLDPTQGYYASANSPDQGRDVLGAKGDFITSPEISQVFGELLAIYFVSRWQAVATPQEVRLVEFGPGKGTLLADMIRTFARFPILKSLKTIHLVETSDGLMRLQLKAIEGALQAAGKRIAMPPSDPANPTALKDDEVAVEYFPLVDAVPISRNQWTILVAHEFFDALPIHIFEKTIKGFREVLVDTKRETFYQEPTGQTTRQAGQSGVTTIKVSDLRRNRPSGSSTDSDGKLSSSLSASSSPPPVFQYVLSPSETPWTKLLASSNPRFRSLQPGQRVEISPESWATARKIGEIVAGRKAVVPEESRKLMGRAAGGEEEDEEEAMQRSLGGVGLIVDYGDEKAFGGSFRAFKSHSIVSPLQAPGQADLTANVDFAYLRNALATTTSRSLGPMFQSHFLQSLGFGPRVEALVKTASATATTKGAGTGTGEQSRSNSRGKEIESAAKRLVDMTGMGAQYKVLGIEGGTGGEQDVWPFDFEAQLVGRAEDEGKGQGG